jgi:hypothetical protein
VGLITKLERVFAQTAYAGGENGGGFAIVEGLAGIGKELIDILEIERGSILRVGSGSEA